MHAKHGLACLVVALALVAGVGIGVFGLPATAAVARSAAYSSAHAGLIAATPTTPGLRPSGFGGRPRVPDLDSRFQPVFLQAAGALEATASERGTSAARASLALVRGRPEEALILLEAERSRDARGENDRLVAIALTALSGLSERWVEALDGFARLSEGDAAPPEARSNLHWVEEQTGLRVGASARETIAPSERLEKLLEASLLAEPDARLLDEALALAQAFEKRFGDRLYLEEAEIQRLLASQRAGPAGPARWRQRQSALRHLASGQSLRRRGECNRALGEFASAAKDFEATGARGLWHHARFFRLVCIARGEPAVGVRLLKEYAESAEEASYRALSGRARWMLATTEARLDQASAAARDYRRALAVFAELEDHENEAVLHGMLADLLFAAGQARESWRLRLRSLAQPMRPARRIEALARSADIADASGWPAAAERFKSAEIALVAKDGGPLEIITSQLFRARLRVLNDHFGGARADLAAIEGDLARLEDPNLRELFGERWRLVDAMVRARTTTGPQALEGFESPILWAERASDGHFLAEALEERGSAALALHLPDRAAADLGRALSVVADAGIQPFAADLERRRILERLLRTDTLSQLALGRTPLDLALHLEMRRRQLQPGGRSRAVALDAEAVRQMLASQPALAIVLLRPLDEHSSLALVLTARDSTRHLLPLGGADLRRGLRQPPLRAVTDLGQRILEPLASELQAASRITFVPQGEYWSVPFAELIEPGSSIPIPLGHRARVAVASGFGTSDSDPSLERGGEALVVRSPSSASPGSIPALSLAGETSGLEGLARRTIELRGSAALKADVTEALTRARWVHIAAHGLSPAAVEPSILLAGGEELTASELAALDLSSVDLFVLASCAGASGLEELPESSLARAALAAGAGAVIAPLRDVDERDAARVFGSLYRNLARGDSLGQAFQTALRETAGSTAESPWFGLFLKPAD